MSRSLSALVTGGTGYLASELVTQLLEKGYSVRTTVRSKDSSRCVYLQTLVEQYPSKLELFEADLLQDGSLNNAVEGVDYVFHTASPFFGNSSNPQADLIDPAINGTRNILQSCIQRNSEASEAIRKIVVTSSMAAVRGIGSLPSNGQFFTTEDWNMESKIDGEGGLDAYMLSKRLAEEEAWRLALEHRLNLQVVNPAFIIGPPRSPHLLPSTSCQWMLGWIRDGFMDFPRNLVDVRDVAKAHIMVAEDESEASSSLGYESIIPDCSRGRWFASGESMVFPYTIAGFLRNDERCQAICGVSEEHTLPREGEAETGSVKNVDASRLFTELPSNLPSEANDQSPPFPCFTSLERSVVDMCLAMAEWQEVREQKEQAAETKET
jgi:nucleoside-diphosphate-sugar epimerase